MGWCQEALTAGHGDAPGGDRTRTEVEGAGTDGARTIFHFVNLSGHGKRTTPQGVGGTVQEVLR